MARKGTTAKPRPVITSPSIIAAQDRAARMAGMTRRAWLAAQRMRKMLPMLQKYARVITGNPNVMVQASHEGTFTDGTTIYIKPPMRLGEDVKHDTGSCNIRDSERRRLICPACDAHEMVMGLIYHEIAHLAFGSFVPPQYGGKAVFVKLVNEWHPLSACEHAFDLLDKLNKAKSYLEMAGIFDERMCLTLNAQEDTRVNAAMFEARPGTKVMLDANMHDVFTSGIESADGTVIRWGDAQIDMQVSIGMLLMASDSQEYLDQLHPDAQEILGDEVLMELAAVMAGSSSVHELVGYSAAAWRRFQELGVFMKDKCVPPPAEDDDEDTDNSDDSDDSDDESDVSPDQEEPAVEEDTDGDDGQGDDDQGDKPDIGSLGNEGQPSPSQGDGEGGQGTDEGKGDGAGDDAAQGDEGGAGDPSDSGDAAGEGVPDAEGGDADQDSDASGMSGMSGTEGATTAGSGDRVQDGATEGSDGADDEGIPEGSDGSRKGDDLDLPDGDVSDVDVAAGQGTDGGQGEPGKDVSDGDLASEQGEAAGSQEVQGDRTDAESSDTEPEGGTAGSSGDGGDDADAEGTDQVFGPDDDGEIALAPANYDPATAEQLRAILKEASIHAILGDESTEDFAGGHSELNQDPIDARELELWTDLLMTALSQAAYFEGPAEDIGTVEIIKFGDDNVCSFNEKKVREWTDLMPPGTVVGPIVNAGRVAFSPNKRTRFETGLRSGKINPRALARQIPQGGDQIFRKRNVEAKRNYHVVITVDVSGSTNSAAPSDHYPEQTTLQMMVRSVFAQAEALNRLGISFEIWAHTAGYFLHPEDGINRHRIDFKYPDINLWFIQVKTPDEPWNDKVRSRMTALRPLSGNLDGHTLEFMRKRAEDMRKKFTGVMICYYTDGAMAASNADDEADVMRRETALCRQRDIPLLAVAAGTDSPTQWGFDTVVINSDDDLPKVMKQLQRHIL